MEDAYWREWTAAAASHFDELVLSRDWMAMLSLQPALDAWPELHVKETSAHCRLHCHVQAQSMLCY